MWADCFEEGGIYSGHGPEAITGGPGLSRAEVLCHIGQESNASPNASLDDSIGDQGWYGRNRESPEEAILRAGMVIGRLKETFGASGEAITIVTHADFKRKLLTQMLDGAVDATSLGALRNTGITKVNFNGERWQLDWFNSVSHLPAKLITAVEH